MEIASFVECAGAIAKIRAILIDPVDEHQPMPWFVKIEKGIVDKPTFDQFVPAHRAYVNALIEQGHHAKTGYWAERGGGMLLFQAATLEDAKAIVAQDPLVVNGCVAYELHEWVIVVE